MMFSLACKVVHVHLKTVTLVIVVIISRLLDVIKDVVLTTYYSFEFRTSPLFHNCIINPLTLGKLLIK